MWNWWWFNNEVVEIPPIFLSWVPSWSPIRQYTIMSGPLEELGLKPTSTGLMMLRPESLVASAEDSVSGPLAPLGA